MSASRCIICTEICADHSPLCAACVECISAVCDVYPLVLEQKDRDELRGGAAVAVATVQRTIRARGRGIDPRH